MLDLARSNGLPSQKSDTTLTHVLLLSDYESSSLKVSVLCYVPADKCRLLSSGCADMSLSALRGTCVVTVSLATSVSALPEHASI